MTTRKIHLDLIGGGNQQTRAIHETDVLLRHRMIVIKRTSIGDVNVGFALCRKASARPALCITRICRPFYHAVSGRCISQHMWTKLIQSMWCNRNCLLLVPMMCVKAWTFTVVAPLTDGLACCQAIHTLRGRRPAVKRANRNPTPLSPMW
jgi:hypothetical protein